MRKYEAERIKVTEADGTIRTLLKMVTQVPFKPLSGGIQWNDGGHEFVLDTGEDVNQLDTDTFETVMNERILKRMSASA